MHLELERQCCCYEIDEAVATICICVGIEWKINKVVSICESCIIDNSLIRIWVLCSLEVVDRLWVGSHVLFVDLLVQWLQLRLIKHPGLQDGSVILEVSWEWLVQGVEANDELVFGELVGKDLPVFDEFVDEVLFWDHVQVDEIFGAICDFSLINQKFLELRS